MHPRNKSRNETTWRENAGPLHAPPIKPCAEGFRLRSARFGSSGGEDACLERCGLLAHAVGGALARLLACRREDGTRDGRRQTKGRWGALSPGSNFPRKEKRDGQRSGAGGWQCPCDTLSGRAIPCISTREGRVVCCHFTREVVPSNSTSEERVIPHDYTREGGVIPCGCYKRAHSSCRPSSSSRASPSSRSCSCPPRPGGISRRQTGGAGRG